MNVQAPTLSFAGFNLWKVDPKDAAEHPTGTEYAGIARTPDGQLWGVQAHVIEVNGRKQFQGGLYPLDPYADAAAPTVAPPVDGLLLPSGAPGCAESRPVQHRTPSAGTPPAQPDLVSMAEGITRDIAELDDSAVLEELPL